MGNIREAARLNRYNGAVMDLRRQRNTTITIIALAVVAFGVRIYLDKREHFRTTKEVASFSISNGVAHFSIPRGRFIRTNTDLVQLLERANGTTVVVTVRERFAGDRYISWKAVAIDVPAKK